ncbi:hypothetical protein LINGRAHAP2_LOCUS35456, partial [Linum grandiflorum]
CGVWFIQIELWGLRCYGLTVEARKKDEGVERKVVRIQFDSVRRENIVFNND